MLAYRLARAAQPQRYAINPRRAGALRQMLAVRGRVGGLTPQGPDFLALMAGLSPLEQLLVVELLAQGGL